MKLSKRSKARVFLSLIFFGLLVFIIGKSIKGKEINLFLLLLESLIFLGIVYISKNIITHIKEKYGDLALKISKEIIQKICSLILFLYGFYLVFSVIAYDYIEDLISYPKSVLIRTLLFMTIDLLIGFVFIILAKVLLDKQKRSTKILYPSLIFSIIYLLIGGENIITVFPLILVMAMAYYTKDVLDKERYIYSWEEKTLDIFFIFILVLFSTIYTKKRSTSSTYILGYRFLYIIFSLVLLFIVGKIIFSYLKKGRGLGANYSLEELDKLIEKYSSKQSLAAGLAYLNDKSLYFYEDDKAEKTVAFQYGIINNKAIVMGEPFGKDEDIGDALYEFNEACIKSGLSPIFYEVGEKFTLALHDYGYDFMKFGENALVDLDEFSLNGRKKSTERNILNRFKKEGYKFKVINPPYLRDFLDELGKISDSWLGSREEKGFSLGFFDRNYLSKSDIAIVLDKEGQITAFANIMPNNNKEVLTIDLMRYDRQKNVNSMMDFLFLSLYLYGQENSYKYFNLGMAPLANVGLMKSAYLSERIAYLVYKHGNKFYSFEGLRNYKNKYASVWLPKYIAYSKGNWLLYSLLALALIDKKSNILD